MKVQQCVPRQAQREVQALVQAVGAVPSRRPFDPALVDLCAAVSAGLLAHPASRRFPELVALAFWLRRAELARLADEHRALATASTLLAPRGLVLHLPPANVGTIAVYSWALSLLVGNRNIVRLSSRASPVTDTIVEVIATALAAAPADLAQGNIFLRYGHEDDITAALSAACDLRLVWGGDASVAAVRAIPLPPRALELSFADRWSLSAIGTRAYRALDAEGRQHLAEAFFNDAYWFDQLGCASPRLVAWIGPDADPCSRDFFAAVARVAAQRGWTLDAGRALDREHFAWRAALDAPVRDVRREADSVLVLDLDHMTDLSRDHVGGGVFFQVQLDRLDDLVPHIQRRDQTLGHFGLDPAALRRFAAGVAGRGLDRIVPIGRALAFDRYWEGHDLLQALSRRVVLELDR